MVEFGSVPWLIAVSALWGFTNPLMKKNSQGIEKVKGQGFLGQWLAEIGFVLGNWKNLMVFAMNQSGSLIFYMALASADLTSAVIVTNSLTFIFTSLAGFILGEKTLSKVSYAGMMLVFIGLSVCIYEQSNVNRVKDTT